MHEDCKTLFEKISGYLDGELDTATCEEIEVHLQECPECAKCFESLKKTVSLCKKFPQEKVPMEVRKRLRAALRDYRTR
ncbi:MAG: zf-HC2 domain-containing protein [Deltaproteobacteria bacterium]|nr:zf-HC2 domain-containing protein [Deltaproteobacteria bacterium]